MKNKTFKIGISCFMGALIGTFTGLQFEFRIVGFLISVLSGGIAGYLLFEIDTVAKAIPSAFKETMSKETRRKIGKSFFTAGKFFLYAICFGSLITITIIAIGLLPSATADLFMKGNQVDYFVLFPFYVGGIGVVTLVVVMWLICGGKRIRKSFEEIFSGDKDGLRTWQMLFFGNPITIPFTAIGFILFGLFILAKKLPTYLAKGFKYSNLFFKWLRRFSKTVFILIHSEMRLICLVDSALGAGIGYLSGSLLIGGLVGCAFGILNYWIVSIKILKLKQIK